MHDFIKARLASHTLDDIRKMLGFVDLREGHFCDKETIVETDAKGNVVFIGSPGRVIRDNRKGTQPEPEPEPNFLDEAMDDEFEEEEFEEEDLEDETGEEE